MHVMSERGRARDYLFGGDICSHVCSREPPKPREYGKNPTDHSAHRNGPGSILRACFAESASEVGAMELVVVEVNYQPLLLIFVFILVCKLLRSFLSPLVRLVGLPHYRTGRPALHSGQCAMCFRFYVR